MQCDIKYTDLVTQFYDVVSTSGLSFIKPCAKIIIYLVKKQEIVCKHKAKTIRNVFIYLFIFSLLNKLKRVSVAGQKPTRLPVYFGPEQPFPASSRL